MRGQVKEPVTVEISLLPVQYQVQETNCQMLVEWQNEWMHASTKEEMNGFLGLCQTL